ncbi:hypothetical protein IW261DRAFT_1049723 [Armillaria novae-zelandiae]|uniref:Uncharacterized protein n=1 Tax=Armillaria novae-zelandiae TaxID=153914 RepID=A0AA39PEG9_9AGAR|nr:hypothetical protein IW261DRAFT_1049723 [Armillaria novae-zelandiae]
MCICTGTHFLFTSSATASLLWYRVTRSFQLSFFVADCISIQLEIVPSFFVARIPRIGTTQENARKLACYDCSIYSILSAAALSWPRAYDCLSMVYCHRYLAFEVCYPFLASDISVHLLEIGWHDLVSLTRILRGASHLFSLAMAPFLITRPCCEEAIDLWEPISIIHCSGF